MIKSSNIINTLKAGEMVAEADIPKELMGLFHPTVQPFIISNMRYEPTALAAECRVPMLIVSGGRDFQVSLSNGKRIQEAQPAAEHAIFENMTHVLKDADTSDRVMQLVSVYTNASQPITEGVAAKIAEFVNNIK